MAKKTYYEKLKDPRWQKKRLEILNLKGFKCEKCGCEEKELHVHHRFYIKGREVWQYDNDVFQVLCCDCHEKEHSKESNQNTIEVVPEKYIQLIKLYEESIVKFPPNSHAIMEVLYEYVHNIKNPEYFSNIAIINATMKGVLLEAIIYDFSESILTESGYSERLEKLEEFIEKLKSS